MTTVSEIFWHKNSHGKCPQCGRETSSKTAVLTAVSGPKPGCGTCDDRKTKRLLNG